MSNQVIKNTFKVYSSLKEDNDYFIKHPDNANELVSTGISLFTKSEKKLVRFEDKVAIYKKDFIDKRHPDKININKFWEEATTAFPYFSIAGGTRIINDLEDLHNSMLHLHKLLGCLDHLDKQFLKKKNTRFLEIGAGRGSLFYAMEKLNWTENYYAIDVNPLFEYKHLYKCDGRNIPNTIPYPMDMVYSVNVFQHLSKSQRTSYYRQIYEILADNGTFIFGMFVRTPENRNWDCWQARDEANRYYATFFKQLTEIDEIEELEAELNDIGFDMERISPIENQVQYLTFKCTKK